MTALLREYRDPWKGALASARKTKGAEPYAAIFPNGREVSGYVLRDSANTAVFIIGVTGPVALRRTGAVLIPFNGAKFLVTPTYDEALEQEWEVCE